MRRLNLSTFAGDADWTDPANSPPNSARRFKVVAAEVMFEIVALAGTAPDADQVAVGTLEVDGWVGYDGPGLPLGGKTVPTIRRGQSLVEAFGSTLSTAVRFKARNAEVGGVGRLNLTFTGALPAAVEVRIVSGARLL